MRKGKIMGKMAIGLAIAVCCLLVFASSSSSEEKQKEEGMIKKLIKAAKLPGSPARPATVPAAPAVAKPAATKPATVQKSVGDMTQEELLSAMKKTLDSNKDILNNIPEIKKERAPDGKEYYTYKGMSIDALDKDTLRKVIVRVRNENIRLRTERINRQLDNIKKSGPVGGGAHMGIPPTVKLPPQTPRVIVTPPMPPKVPKVPPTPPKR